MSHDHGARSRTASSRLLAVVVARRMRRQPTPEIQRRAARRRLGQRHNDHSPRRQVACHGHRTRPGQWYLGGTMPAFSGPPRTVGSNGSIPTRSKRAPFLRIFRAGSTCGADRSSPTPTVRSCRSTAASCTGSIPTTCPSSSNAGSPPTAPTTACWRSSTAPWSPRIFVSKARAEPPSRGSIPARSNSSAGRSCSPRARMGRIAADTAPDGSDVVYVPGTEHLWRLRIDGDELTVDDWRPRYRTAHDRYGLSWDTCLSDGYCWAMDCGDVRSVRRIHETEPNGRYEQPPGKDLSWRLPAPWAGAQRLFRVARRPCRHSGDRTVRNPWRGHHRSTIPCARSHGDRFGQRRRWPRRRLSTAGHGCPR